MQKVYAGLIVLFLLVILDGGCKVFIGVGSPRGDKKRNTRRLCFEEIEFYTDSTFKKKISPGEDKIVDAGHKKIVEYLGKYSDARDEINSVLNKYGLSSVVCPEHENKKDKKDKGKKEDGENEKVLHIKVALAYKLDTTIHLWTRFSIYDGKEHLFDVPGEIEAGLGIVFDRDKCEKKLREFGRKIVHKIAKKLRGEEKDSKRSED